MKNNDLYLGIGLGMAAGVLSSLMMRPKRKNIKSAVAHIIGDVAVMRLLSRSKSTSKPLI